MSASRCACLSACLPLSVCPSLTVFLSLSVCLPVYKFPRAYLAASPALCGSAMVSTKVSSPTYQTLKASDQNFFFLSHPVHLVHSESHLVNSGFLYEKIMWVYFMTRSLEKPALLHLQKTPLKMLLKVSVCSSGLLLWPSMAVCDSSTTEDLLTGLVRWSSKLQGPTKS